MLDRVVARPIARFAEHSSAAFRPKMHPVDRSSGRRTHLRHPGRSREGQGMGGDAANAACAAFIWTIVLYIRPGC